jgi:hypothetical protein
MKKIIAFCFILIAMSGCRFIDRIKPKSSKVDLIAASLWKIDALKDAADKNLKNENLDPRAQSLYGIVFDFKANKIVRASDKVSKQILNQGTWSLNADESIITIDLPEFNGTFKIIQVSSKSFLMQYLGEKKFAGLGTGVQLILIPEGN